MPLTPFAEDIWTADGTDLFVLGFRYATRCAVIKLSDGGLLIWSPVTLSSALKVAIAEIGPVTHLIAPNHLHHLFIDQWQVAYPNAKLFGLPGLRDKRADLKFDGLLEPTANPDWMDVLDQQIIDNLITREVVFFHKPSRTVIFTDLIQQFPDGWHRGFRKVIAQLDLMIGTRPNVPRKFRLGFANRKKAREQLAKVFDWPTQRILLAHGDPVRADGKAILAQAFAWLQRSPHK